MKKTVSIVLVAVLILLIALTSVFAKEEQVYSGTFGENLTWSFDKDKKELVISGEGAMPDYNSGGYFVEDTIIDSSQDVSKDVSSEYSSEDYSDDIPVSSDVTHIVQTEPSYSDGDPSRPWDEIKDKINIIVIEDGVTHIGDYAFYSCYNLTSVTIGNGVKTVGERAFSDCYNLTKVKIGKSVLTVDDHAFPYYEMDARNIEVVYYSGSEEQWKSIKLGTDNSGLKYSLVIVDCDGSRPKSLAMSFGENLFGTFYTDGELVIDGEGEMEYIYFESSVPWRRFKSKITKITIGDGVESIAGGCEFINCDNLTSVNIGKGVTSIGSIPFQGCSSLESIDVDEGNAAFSSDEYGVLFNKDKTELISYPIGNKRTSYTVPDSVISIDSTAFDGSENLKSITFGDGITRIEGGTFRGCINLEEVTFSKNIDYVCKGAFYLCDNITDIYFMGTKAAWQFVGGISLDNGSMLTATVHFAQPEEKLLTGKCGDNLIWILETATGKLVISGIGEMYDYKFDANFGIIELPEWCYYDITSVTLEDGVTSIGECAFYSCENLKSVSLPEGLVSIGRDSFVGCTSLKEISIPDSVNSIGDTAFFCCESLEKITIPDNVICIDGSTFSGCSALTTITIPADMKKISIWAFDFCPNLADVYYNGTQEQWENIEVEKGNEYLLNATIHFCEASETKLGDVSGDNKINSSDALVCLQHSVGKFTLTGDALTVADVNKDGCVNSSDALRILQYSVGKITHF